MIQQILTPIDIDVESSENVVRYAIELSKVFGAKLIYFHVYLPPNLHNPNPQHMNGAGLPTQSLPSIPIDHDELKQNQFKHLIDKVPEATAVPHDYYAAPGVFDDAYKEYAKELEVDLVLMGTREVLGIEAFIGTMAEKITRNSPCPVIVIPRDYPFRAIKKICLAIDHDHTIDEQDLSILLLIAKGLDTPLSIIHVQRSKDEIEESEADLLTQLKKKMEKYQIDYSFCTIESEDVERGIIEFTEKNQIDLLALVYREHGFFKRMFNPGIRKKLVSQSELPLLILK